jgi:predicted O-methyltransferase YrrM
VYFLHHGWMLTWTEGEHFIAGETSFQALRLGTAEHRDPPQEGEFLIFKPRPLVEQYAALVAELRPQRIVELGVRKGGSALFFAELARPERLVAIDRQALMQVIERVSSHATARGLSEVVQIFGGVDQADRSRVAQIVEEQFEGSPLDLVVDDCSHLYDPTRASFNELFPRLRPGGRYVIEDWRWAHPPLDSGHRERVLYPDQVPLTRLLFEIALGIPAVPGLISEISINLRVAVVTRGDAQVDRGAFEISEYAKPTGQTLLQGLGAGVPPSR